MHKEAPAQCVLTVTSLTSDISSEQHLAAVIQPNTHYQLIPASPETTSHLTPLIPTLLNESKYEFFYLGEKSWMFACHINATPRVSTINTIWDGTYS